MPRLASVARCFRGITALALLALALLGGCKYQQAIIWPLAERQLAPLEPSPGVEVVRVPHAAGYSEAWFVRAAGASAERPGPAVIYFHGNSERVANNLGLAEFYARRGVSVLLPEYRGYGNSQGVPTVEGLRADMVAFHDWLAARPEVDAARIVHHGYSIGGAVAADLAAQRPPAALILRATFTSMRAMFRQHRFPEVLVQYDYRTDEVVRAAEFPILLIHGRRDGVIPVQHSRTLATLNPRAQYVETDEGHNVSPTPAFLEHTIFGFLRENRVLADRGPR